MTISLISRYLWRNTSISIVFCLLALLSLFGFFDFLAELGRTGKDGYTSTLAGIYVLLSLPVRLYEIFPIAILIGGIFALSQLVAHSEYTIMRASGLSVGQILRRLSLLGLVLASITFVLGEYIAPISEQAAKQVKLLAKQRAIGTQSDKKDLWLRDGKQIIHIQEALPDGSLRNLQILQISPAFTLERSLQAERATYHGTHWQLHQVQSTTWHGAQLHIQQLGQMPWQSQITPEVTQWLKTEPEEMSARHLAQYAQRLEANGQNPAQYRTALWGKISYPLVSLIMLLLALPFAHHNRRSGGIGTQIVVGIMVGLGFYFCNKLIQVTGLRYGWPAPLSALLSLIIFSSVGAWLLYRQERR